MSQVELVLLLCISLFLFGFFKPSSRCLRFYFYFYFFTFRCGCFVFAVFCRFFLMLTIIEFYLFVLFLNMPHILFFYIFCMSFSPFLFHYFSFCYFICKSFFLLLLFCNGGGSSESDIIRSALRGYSTQIWGI